MAEHGGAEGLNLIGQHILLIHFHLDASVLIALEGIGEALDQGGTNAVRFLGGA